MNWFLNGFHHDNRMKDIFAFAGRLLLLSQELEKSIKYVVPIILFAEKKEIENKADFDSMIDFFKKNSEKFIGRLRNELKDVFNNDDYESLKLSIDARNFICHELTMSLHDLRYDSDISHEERLLYFDKLIDRLSKELDNPLNDPLENYRLRELRRSQYITKYITRVRSFIQSDKIKVIVNDLALGSYIIMHIQHCITEKESFFIEKQQYLKKFINFAFNNK